MADVVRVLAAIAALFLMLMALLGAVYWTAFRRGHKRRVVARPPVPNHGPCGVCGKDVSHVYPWWTANPETHPEAKPLHEGRCFQEWSD